MTAAAERSSGAAWRLWACLGLLWCATLPWRPVLDPDEGRYAEIPREMVATGDWLVPHLNGLVYFEKPPLQYWATAAAYSVFGPAEWSSRLWAAVLAFLCVPLVYGFARAVGRPRELALTAALILAVNPYFVIIGQLNLLDQAFTFFLVAAVFSFVLAQKEPPKSGRERAWMLAAWAALALSVMSKGIVSIFLVGATLVVHVVLARDLSVLRRMHFTLGLPLFAAIAVPWFWAVQESHPGFASFFFMHEHFARFLTTIHRRTEPWWFFPGILLFALTPVVLCVPAAFRLSQRLEPAPGAFPVRRFLVIWCTVVLLFFTVSQSKLAPYILPMMPPLALLLAPAVREQPAASSRGAIALALTLLTVGLAMVLACLHRAGYVDPDVLTWAAIAVLCGFAAVLAGMIPRIAGREPAGWIAVAAATILGYQALFMAYSRFPPQRTAKEMALQASRSIGPGTELYTVGQYRHSISFYLGRTLRIVAYEGEFEFGLERAATRPLDVRQFRREWDSSSDAVAFFEPVNYLEFARDGLPGRVIASDGRGVAVSRR